MTHTQSRPTSATRRRIVLTTALTATCVAATGTGMAAAGTAPVAHAHTMRLPAYTSEARAHHLAAGGGVMGWATKTVTSQAISTPAPARRSVTSLAGAPQPAGIDVSSYSGTVAWSAFKASGTSFAYVKATEGTYYTNPLFTAQRSGASSAGMLTGAYHFANPATSSGVAQADFLVAHGGGFTAGRSQLPGAVDLEWDPYSSDACYGLTQAQMYAWITAFQNEYKAKTGVFPVVYTARQWWNACVGTGLGSAVIAARSPLWVSNFATTPGTLPSGWIDHTIWQDSTSSTGGYDVDVLNGGPNQLQALSIVG